MTITRGNPQKNYQLINEFGLDYAENVLEISDVGSGIFDDEIKGETINILKEQIEELEISISEREYELQGVIPNSLPRVSSSDRYQQEKVYECSDITQ
jgi:hypothetical protein